MIRRAVAISSCVLASLAISACGSGSSGSTVTPKNAAKTAGGATVVSNSGGAVSKSAFRRWNSAVKFFEKQEESGWTETSCVDAVKNFEDAADAQSGGFSEAIFMQGLSYARCGHIKEANRAYERALKNNPKSCQARVALALNSVSGASELSRVRGEFERAIRDDPQCTSAYTNLAMVQRQAGGAQEEEALRNLRRALAIESDYLPAFNEMALLHLGRGKEGKRAELDLAEVVCRQAQLIDADYAPIYNTWGLIKMTKGDVIEALRFFEKAIALDPSLFEAQMNFGELTVSFRGYEDGEKSYGAASRLRPDNYEAALGHGTALRGLQKYAEAEAEFERASDLDSRRPEAYFNLGVLYQDYMSGSIADMKKAQEFFRDFLKRASQRNDLAAEVKSVSQRCAQQQKSRRRRTRKDCRPGRLQNIETIIEALKVRG